MVLHEIWELYKILLSHFTLYEELCFYPYGCCHACCAHAWSVHILLYVCTVPFALWVHMQVRTIKSQFVSFKFHMPKMVHYIDCVFSISEEQ
jgi:hypothetical protein